MSAGLQDGGSRNARGSRAIHRPASRAVLCAALAFMAWGCATTRPAKQGQEPSRGVASWYGEEFAGRTTANGEIFDPKLLTAAHRTYPFGTLLDVTNAKTKQTVRVRVNDRGPFIGNRVIDLSWAAADKIGLVEPGIGDVEIRMVRLGAGDREPPVPFEVAITDAPRTPATAASGSPPEVAFPLPPGRKQPVIAERAVPVEPQRSDAAPGRVAANPTQQAAPVPAPAPVEEVVLVETPAPANPGAALTRAGDAQFFVQVGAFAVEENAKALQEKVIALGEKALIEATDLFRVRVGPFVSRSQAVTVRALLESKGLSAMIVAE